MITNLITQLKEFTVPFGELKEFLGKDKSIELFKQVDVRGQFGYIEDYLRSKSICFIITFNDFEKSTIITAHKWGEIKYISLGSNTNNDINIARTLQIISVFKYLQEPF